MEKYAIGGQAVLEGVAMRSPNNWVVAVRKPDGEITHKAEKVNQLVEKYPVLKWGILRGIVNLIQTLIIGFKAINYSANVSMGEEEKKLSAMEIVFTFTLAFALTVGLFMAVPYFTTRLIAKLTSNRLLFTTIEGLIRIGIFVGYIFVISYLKDIRRVFQYHGAEHKLVNTLEAGEELTIENAKKHPTIHPSCGTTFLIIVLILAILIFSLLPTKTFYLRLVGKILVVPFIAGVSYEIIRFARRHRRSHLMKILIAPGLWLQKLTTKEPTNEQLEVAKFALEKVIALENVGK